MPGGDQRTGCRGVWHNFDDRLVTSEASGRTLRWLHQRVVDIAWEDVAVLPTPEGFVWQAVLKGTAPGGPLRVHTCLVARGSPAGLVWRADEYLDPTAMAVLPRPVER